MMQELAAHEFEHFGEINWIESLPSPFRESLLELFKSIQEKVREYSEYEKLIVKYKRLLDESKKDYFSPAEPPILHRQLEKALGISSIEESPGEPLSLEGDASIYGYSQDEKTEISSLLLTVLESVSARHQLDRPLPRAKQMHISEQAYANQQKLKPQIEALRNKLWTLRGRPHIQLEIQPDNKVSDRADLIIQHLASLIPEHRQEQLQRKAQFTENENLIHQATEKLEQLKGVMVRDFVGKMRDYLQSLSLPQLRKLLSSLDQVPKYENDDNSELAIFFYFLQTEVIVEQQVKQDSREKNLYTIELALLAIALMILVTGTAFIGVTQLRYEQQRIATQQLIQSVGLDAFATVLGKTKPNDDISTVDTEITPSMPLPTETPFIPPTPTTTPRGLTEITAIKPVIEEQSPQTDKRIEPSSTPLPNLNEDPLYDETRDSEYIIPQGDSLWDWYDAHLGQAEHLDNEFQLFLPEFLAKINIIGSPGQIYDIMNRNTHLSREKLQAINAARAFWRVAYPFGISGTRTLLGQADSNYRYDGIETEMYVKFWNFFQAEENAEDIAIIITTQYPLNPNSSLPEQYKRVFEAVR